MMLKIMINDVDDDDVVVDNDNDVVDDDDDDDDGEWGVIKLSWRKHLGNLTSTDANTTMTSR